MKHKTYDNSTANNVNTFEHKKDNTLSNGLIKLNRKTFSDLFFAMQVAEKGKEIVNNPPQ